MMTKKIAWFIILFLPTLVFAQDNPSMKNPESMSFNDCEYIVFFPVKTKRKISHIGKFESLMAQSVYDGKSPFLRAECLPLTNRSETIASLKTILENQAKLSGIKLPEIIIEDGALGQIGTYSGVRKAGGFDIKIFGKLIIGNTSILSLLVSEELSKFPSDKVVFFLNTVKKK